MVTAGFIFGSSSLTTRQWFCPGGPWLGRDIPPQILLSTVGQQDCSHRWAHCILHPTTAPDRRWLWHRVLGWQDMQPGVLCPLCLGTPAQQELTAPSSRPQDPQQRPAPPQPRCGHWVLLQAQPGQAG